MKRIRNIFIFLAVNLAFIHVSQADITLSTTLTLGLNGGVDTNGFVGSTWTFTYTISDTTYDDYFSYPAVLSDSASVTISGVGNPIYNGTFPITETTTTNFLFWPNALGNAYLSTNPSTGSDSSFSIGTAPNTLAVVSLNLVGPSSASVSIGGPVEAAHFDGLAVSDGGVSVGSTVYSFNNGTVSATVPSSNTAPTFNDGTITTLTVNENSSATSINTLLDIADTDTGDTLTWSVTSGPGKGTLGGFPGNGSSNGGNVTPTGLTYTPTANTTGSDNFTIEVSDGTDTDSITVNVTISDVNPTITANSGSIAEDASVNDLVLTMAATGDTNGLSWSITGGNTGTAFAINASGQITVANALDFETTPSYTLTIAVDDEDVDSTADDTESVTITVTDTGVRSLGTPAVSFADEDLTLENFTVPAGTDRALVVLAGNSASNDILTVSFNGLPLTEVVERTDSTAVDSIWVRAMGSSASPTTGNIVVTRQDGAGTGKQFISAHVYEEVDQATPMGQEESAQGTATNVGSSLTVTSIPGDVVIDLFDTARTSSPAPTATEGAGQTLVHTQAGTIQTGTGRYSVSTEPGASSVPMSWTSTGQGMLHVAANIKQVSSLSPTTTTVAASGVSDVSAVFNATVNPNGTGITVVFEYSENATLASGVTTTPVQDVGSGSVAVPVTFAQGSLSASTTYYFRAKSTNANGTTTGSILSFTTNAPSSGGPITQIGGLGSSSATDDNILENYTLAAGTNRVLIVTASHASDTDITGVSFAGQPLTQVVERTDGFAVDSIWVRAMGTSATSTTGNIVVTRAGTDSSMQVILAVAYENVDQLTPMDGAQANDATGTNVGSSVTVTSETGDLVFDLFDTYKPSAPQPSITAGAGQTQLHSTVGGALASGGVGSWGTSTEPGAPSVTMSWTSDATAIIQVAANINRAPGPSNTPPTVTGVPTDVSVIEDIFSNFDLSASSFADVDGDSLTVTLAASTGTLSALSGGGVTVGGSGSGSLTLSGTVTNINTFLDTASNIQYAGASNLSGDNAATFTINANDGTVNPEVGSGNIDITPVNDAPTLFATGGNPIFTEGGSAVDLYNTVSANTVEVADRFSSMTLTVTNVSDSANEILTFDGSDVALTHGNSVTTATNGLSVTVSVTGSTATVSFSGASLTNAQIQTLVDGMTYRNTSDDPTTAGNRVITLTGITDNGGNANGGSDSAAPNLTSTVTVVAVNNPPVIGNLDGDSSGVEVGNAATIDNGVDATLANPDSDDYNGGSLVIVDNGGNNTANGNFSVDGTGVTSGGDGTVAAGETIAVGGVSIGTVHPTNDGQGGNSLEISFNSNSTNARVEGLLQNLLWGAAAGTGTQTFTATLNDADGTSNGGDQDGTANFSMVIGNPPTLGGTVVDVNLPDNVSSPIDLSPYNIADLEGDTVTLTLEVGEGAIASTDGNGTVSSVTVAGSGSGTMTLQGSAANLNAYLNISTKMEYTPVNDVTTSTTLTVTPADALFTGTPDVIGITVFDGEEPELGSALTASISGNQITFTYYLENLGNVTLSSLSVSNDLDAVLGAGNYSIGTPAFVDDPGTITLNTGFNGSASTGLINSGSLASGDTAAFQVVVTVTALTDQGSGIGQYQNQVTASGTSPLSVGVSDLSDNGTDPDPNGNGNPDEAGENDSTPAVITPATIGDFVWNDLDGDGVQDGGEPGLSGVTLFLDLNANGVLDGGEPNETTNGSGAYDFPGLNAGTYNVRVDPSTVPAGFVLTGGTSPAAVTVTTGEDNNDADFGYQQQNATIGDFVWNDLDGDGVQDGGEPGLSGVTVYLDLNTNGSLDGGEPSDTTDGSGAYDFTGLATGTYSVRVDASTLPSGFVRTGGSMPTPVSLAAGEDFNDADFGYQQQNATIGDFVWNDLNGDGVQDGGEPGLSGVTVYLDLNSNGVLDGGEPSDTTDGSGAYDHTDLATSTYSVRVDISTLPSGFVQTGGTNPVSVALAAGEDYNDADFGYQQQNATIGDFVWNDLNADGIQDGGETGISGVTVYLDLNSNNTLDGGEPTDVTDGGGAYDFTDLPTGTYAVQVDASSLPSGLQLSTANLPDTVSLAVGEDYNDADFGYRPVPFAAFSGSTTFGCGPLTVNFTDASLNTAGWEWDFGDGNTSTAQNPTHTYDQPGSYTVTLVASNGAQQDTETKPNYILVIGPVVAFSETTTSANTIPHQVQFTNESTSGAPIISWLWDFGDSNTSNLPDPLHEYTSYGTFTVSLTVTDIDGCSRTLTKTNLVTLGPVPVFTAAFSPDIIQEGGSSTVTFTIDNSASPLNLTGLDFTANLPAGVIVDTPANAFSTLVGGTVTAVPGSGTIAFSGGSIAAGSTATLSVNVTSSTLGTYVLTSGDLTSSSGNSGTATDTLTVAETPSLIVTTTQDVENNTDGQTSLREAIAYAATLGGVPDVTFSNTTTGGAVNFHDGTVRTITLGGTRLDLEYPITIQGPGADVLGISGNDASQIFGITSADVTILDLTLTNGRAIGVSSGQGGAIRQFSGNTTLTRLHISNSVADTFGGAIQVDNVGSMIITDSTISNNISTNTGTGGGGILNAGTLTIINSTLSGNSAPNATTAGGGGGAILNAGTGQLTLIQTTVTGNRTSTDGGGGAIFAAGTEVLINSIIAGNYKGVGTTPSDIEGGSVNTASNTLIGDAATAGGISDGVNGNLVGNAGSGVLDITTVLDTALSDNGGPTPTHAILPGSPALNTGDTAQALDADSNVLTTDQRGAGFNRVVGPAVDMGAFELPNSPPTLVGTPPNDGIPDQTAVEDDAPIQLVLSTYFDDAEQDPTTLTYTVVSNSNAGLVTPAILDDDLTLTLIADQSGTADLTIRATDNGTLFMESTFTLTVNKQVDLTVTAEEDKDPVLAGNGLPGNLIHQVKVLNNGPSDATNVLVDLSQTLPAGVVLDSVLAGTGSETGGTWTIPALADGTMATITLTMSVPVPVAGGTDSISTTGSITSADEPLTATGDDEATVATSVVSPASVGVTLETAMTPNFANSMIEQRVKVTNNNPDPVVAFRILVSGIPNGVTLFNAQGTTPGGQPYLVWTQALGTGQSVEVLMQYFSNTGLISFTPGYTIELLTAAEAAALLSPPVVGDPLSVVRFVTLPDESVLLEWASVPGKRYFIQTSNDMTTWVTVLPAVTAGANRTQWIDRGPPQTESHPSTLTGMRAYRVVEAD